MARNSISLQQRISVGYNSALSPFFFVPGSSSFFVLSLDIPIDADRIGRIMLLRRRNEIFRFSPSTGALVFYVKTEQFYSMSSTIVFSLFYLPFSFSSFPSSLGTSPSFDAINFTRVTYLPPLCYAPIYSDILELNLVPATHSEALPRLLWLAHLIYVYIPNSDIATAVLYRYIRQLYLRASSRMDEAFNFIIVSDIYNGAFTLFI